VGLTRSGPHLLDANRITLIEGASVPGITSPNFPTTRSTCSWWDQRHATRADVAEQIDIVTTTRSPAACEHLQNSPAATRKIYLSFPHCPCSHGHLELNEDVLLDTPVARVVIHKVDRLVGGHLCARASLSRPDICALALSHSNKISTCTGSTFDLDTGGGVRVPSRLGIGNAHFSHGDFFAI
jgi:hypothetical protein